MKKNGFLVDDLLKQQGEWLKAEGSESDIIISSRARLARNLARFPFLTVCDTKTRTEIAIYIREKLSHIKFEKDIHYLELRDLGPVERLVLAERHLISKEHAAQNGDRGVAIARDETMSIMVNEEDHIRMQVYRSGLQLDQVYSDISWLDDKLEQQLNYAFDSRFGYITSCPTNIGTGLRISALMHLPAIVITKQVDKVLQSLARVHYAIRGFFGEGTAPIGDFFQISNQVCLGISEENIVLEMKRVVPEIIKFERSCRQKLMTEQSHVLEDKIHRAYGLLKNAYTISSDETLELLSSIRLGINLQLIDKIPISLINELVVITQPSHIQRLCGKSLEQPERDVERARIIRERFLSY